MGRPRFALAFTLTLTFTMALLLSGSSALAAGVENCATPQDTTLGASATQSASFLPHRKGVLRVDLSARDIEILWDTMYGASLTADQITTLDNFITSMVTTNGSNPTATDATNLQVLYDVLRRQGNDWNPTDPQDSLSYRVGRNFSGLSDISTYTNADRAHSDVYLFNPSRGLSVDGSWPSQLTSDNEDYSTGHSGTDVRPLNSVMVRGPASAQSIDLAGTGWTRPTGLIRTRADHEIGHSMPPGDGLGPLTELWSAAAEAISGSRDTTASAEFPYTWSLLAQDKLFDVNPPSCTNIRASKSNYQGRTAFMAYVAYNFLNADATRTLAGTVDDLLTRWAKVPSSPRKLSDIQPFLTDANCATCASKNYFRPGGTPLSTRDRLNVLLHNWRVANFVNAPSLDEQQLGYPTWAGFSPAVNQKAWQDFDNCATDDIVALPAILMLGPRQATRDTILGGLRSFRGATYPMSLTQFGSNYWVIRADPSATANSDLVVRVVAQGTYQCNGSLALLASAVAYSIADPAGDKSTLWQHPEAATFASPVQSADVDSATAAVEVVIPNFGLTNRSAVLVLTTGDGPGTPSSQSSGFDYDEAVPYRIEVGLRSGAYQTQNPFTVSARPELPEGEPAWSADGTEIAYYSVDPAVSTLPQIFRKKLDGSAATALAPQTQMQLAPNWSPRGNAIAFERADNTQLSSRVWIADLGPGTSVTLRQLTTLTGCASMPSFQPNGQGLAYTYIPNPNDPSPLCYLRWISFDGTGDGQVALLGSPTNFRRRPRWSADGKLIYVSLYEQGDQVVAFPFNGGPSVTISKVPTQTPGFDLHPGSGRLVIESWQTPSNGANDCSAATVISHRIALRDTSTTLGDTDYRVSYRTLFAQQPAYSPDGTRIVYQVQNRYTNDGGVEERQVSWNHAPVFTAGVDDQVLDAAVPFQVLLQAADVDGEPVTFKADYLPPGSTLYNGNTFRWQNPIAGVYFPVFRALDGSGGVARRVVQVTVNAASGGGDPFRDGDGGCGACLIANQSAMMAGSNVEAGDSATNSYLNGALPGSWITQSARLSKITFDANGSVVVRLTASLPGTVAVDEAHLVYVDHATDAVAVATTSGIRVGRTGPISTVTDVAGDDWMAKLSAAADAGSAIPVPVGTELTITWSESSGYSGLVLECAHAGNGWGDKSGVDVQLKQQGAWASADHISPRQNIDAIGTLTPSATSARLVFLADARLRSIRGLGLDSGTPNEADLQPAAATTSDDLYKVAAVQQVDTSLVTLPAGQSISLTFSSPAVTKGMLRSYFLKLRAAYIPPTGAWSARMQRVPQDVPTEFALLQNHPNPFAQGTTFRFAVPRRAHVRIEVFDVLGRRVSTPIDQVLDAGMHTVEWGGVSGDGQPLGPGIYSYRMTAGGFQANKRLVLLGR